MSTHSNMQQQRSETDAKHSETKPDSHIGMIAFELRGYLPFVRKQVVENGDRKSTWKNWVIVGLLILIIFLLITLLLTVVLGGKIELINQVSQTLDWFLSMLPSSSTDTKP